MRRWQPAIVFTYDPEHPYPAYLCHRDHRVLGRAAFVAVYPLARDHLAFAEQVQAGLLPHAVGEIWLFASSAADAYVDITACFERKLEARLAHESQTADPLALREGWRKRAASIRCGAGLALVEAFTQLSLD